MTEQAELLPDDAADTMRMLLDASDEDLPSHRWPRQLANMIDVSAALFRRRGRTDQDAVTEATEQILALALYFGGRPLYFPNGATLETAMMHARIFHEHTGNNTEALADKYDMTLRNVQRVLKQQTKYRRGLRQKPFIFPERGEP